MGSHLPLVKMSQSDIVAVGQQLFGHGARAAEIDGPFAVRHLSPRNEEMPRQHGGKVFRVFF